MLRSAPFSRLRLWSHSRRQRSLNPAKRSIRIGPASRSRRRPFRSPPSGPGLSSISTLRAGATKATSRISRPKWRSGAFPSPTWRRRSRTSRRRAVPTRTPSFCAPSLRRSRICRGNARKIIDGLDRFGHRQNALADRIRAENEAVQKSSDQKSDGQAPPGAGQSRSAPMGHPHLQRSPSDRHLRLRGADADRTAYRGDRSRGAAGCGAVAPVRPRSATPQGASAAKFARA